MVWFEGACRKDDHSGARDSDYQGRAGEIRRLRWSQWDLGPRQNLRYEGPEWSCRIGGPRQNWRIKGLR